MFSTSSSLTTIFDGNSEPRYEELRAERKFITKAIKNFQEKRHKFDVVTEEDFGNDFKLYEEAQDVDTMRSDIALNIRSWVSKAHDSLDLNADVDRVMLSRMSGYVERARLCLIKNPFIIVENTEEMQALNKLPTLSEILPQKKMSPSLPLPNDGNEVRDNEFRAEDASDPPVAPAPTDNTTSLLVGAIGGVVDNPQRQKRVRRKKSSTFLDTLNRGDNIPAPNPASNFLAMRNNADLEVQRLQQQQPPQR